MDSKIQAATALVAFATARSRGHVAGKVGAIPPVQPVEPVEIMALYFPDVEDGCTFHLYRTEAGATRTV